MARPQAALVAALLLLLLLAGCAAPAPDPCRSLEAAWVVDEVRGDDLLVDDGSLILHVAHSDVLLRQDGACTSIAPSAVRPGDRVGHDAQQVADSLPAQAWPDNVVVER